MYLNAESTTDGIIPQVTGLSRHLILSFSKAYKAASFKKQRDFPFTAGYFLKNEELFEESVS